MEKQISSGQMSRLMESGFLRAAFLLTLLVLAAYLLSGLGNRWGWWNFRTGFEILKYAFFGAVVLFVVTVIGIYKGPPEEYNRRFLLALFPLIVSLVLVFIPLKFIWTAKNLPRIHDITTDFDHPPSFSAILPLRKDAANSAVYGGPEIAALQRKGYPDLNPEILSIAPDQAFQKALAAAQKMGWQLVEANPLDKRIEATDTTLWFGFKDDIVIRVTPQDDGGSRVDVRSVSRVGLSDIGANARRIKNYLKKLTETGMN
ncbi:MAG: DUF1499 domain-containing protein [Nitrospiria bacterium]